MKEGAATAVMVFPSINSIVLDLRDRPAEFFFLVRSSLRRCLICLQKMEPLIFHRLCTRSCFKSRIGLSDVMFLGFKDGLVDSRKAFGLWTGTETEALWDSAGDQSACFHSHRPMLVSEVYFHN